MSRALVLAALLLASASIAPAHAQSLTGTSGLLFIPSARVPADGTAAVGAGWVHRSTTSYYEGQFDFMPITGSLVFLPGVELGLRFSRAFSDTPQALGDRMVLAKWRVLTETARRPALAIGAHDFLRSTDASTNHFHTAYVVASKNLMALLGWPIEAHLGFGGDVLDAKGEVLQGVFGGIDASVTPSFRAMAEYDTEGFNVGLEFKPFGPITILAGVRHLSAVTGGVQLVHRL